MEVENTAWPFRLWGRRPFTEKVSLGRRFEQCALAYCRRRGWRILSRNLKWRGGEIDIVAKDGHSLIVLEVRGRVTSAYLPRHTLSPFKRARILRWAEAQRCQVRVELIEVIGQPPVWGFWLLGWWPEIFGVRMKALRLA